MKKGLCLFLVFFVCLCACTSGGAGETATTTRLAQKNSKLANEGGELVFLVDSGGDPLFREAAEALSRKLEEISGGTLRVRISASIDCEGDVLAGKGDLFFADNRGDSLQSGILSLLARPMLYTGYYPFTLALNSSGTLELLTGDLQKYKIEPLAAFYQPGDFMLTARRTDGEDVSVFPAQGAQSGGVAALRMDSPMRWILMRYGLQVVTGMALEDRLYGVYAGSVALAEISMEEIDKAEWIGSSFTLVGIGHSVSPMWLMMTSASREALSEREQAALKEALAYLFPIIDEGFLQKESDAIARIREKGLSVERRFPELQAAAEKVLSEQLADDPSGKYLVDRIRNME